jgi:hypothetical protein
MEELKAWEGKQKFFKDGNPEVYGYFNWRTWKRMTKWERGMWTPFSQVGKHPIPKEVIDFKEKELELEAAKKRISELEAAAKNVVDATIEERPDDWVEDTGGELTEEEQKDKVKAQLDDLGIRYSHNSKLSTLQKKLDDAINSE